MARVIKPPEITVQLVGQNGNVFNLMAIVANALRKNGFGEEVQCFITDDTSSKSYHEALAVMMRWVDVR